MAELEAVAARLDALPPPLGAESARARDRLLVRLTHRLNARLYTQAGRFDQDPAVSLKILPLLARAAELRGLPADSDARGFLETEMVRGRNAVEATLREAAREAEHFLAAEARP